MIVVRYENCYPFTSLSDLNRATVGVKNLNLCSTEETKSPTSWMAWGVDKASEVKGILHSLRMSMWRSFTLSMHCLTESSLHTSRASSVKVLPYASPAASTSWSFFFRFLIVAITSRQVIENKHIINKASINTQQCKSNIYKGSHCDPFRC